MRIKQTRLLIIAFTINVVVGLLECLVISIPNKAVSCQTEGISFLKANNALGIAILAIKDLSQLVPHLFIPIILYIIPLCAGGFSPGLRVYPALLSKPDFSPKEASLARSTAPSH